MYDLNTQVTLTATPATGFKFDCWLDAYGNTLAVSATYTFVVKESMTFTAVFAALPTPTPTPPPTATPVPPTNTPIPTPVPPTDTPVPPTPTPVPEQGGNPGGEQGGNEGQPG